MTEKTDLCWQCSEFCVYFAEILSIIGALCKGNKCATKENVEKKMIVVKDGYKNDKMIKLDEILGYACEEEYIC